LQGIEDGLSNNAKYAASPILRELEPPTFYGKHHKFAFFVLPSSNEILLKENSRKENRSNH
jgi:hypothetical protein